MKELIVIVGFLIYFIYETMIIAITVTIIAVFIVAKIIKIVID